VKVSNPEYGSLVSIEPLPMEEVRAELSPDVTMISYFVSPNAVHAWVIEHDESHYAGLPIDAGGMDRIVCWARQFGPPVDVRGVKVLGTCDSAATSEEAFDQLFAPLLSAIHQRKLVIVPHGVLHYVPFAALRNRQTERYLIDDYTLTYIPSASALRFLRAKESPVDGGALILGDPETSMSRLPGAAEEASFVARRFGATAHLGADAREELLYAASGRFDLVHLAAHGIYDPKNPLFSRIALAKDESHDGSLTVDEILSTLDLTGVNLVVLSACQSAAGVRSGGDEVVGLTRALLYAGTPGVISTLWNIDDAASAGLMQEFYRRLAGGTSVAEALRQSQLAVKENQRFSNPKYWAAFVLTGDPQGRWIARSPVGAPSF
jgi:CHAT domain-containing protein